MICDCNSGREATECRSCGSTNCEDCSPPEIVNEGTVTEFIVVRCKECEQEIET